MVAGPGVFVRVGVLVGPDGVVAVGVGVRVGVGVGVLVGVGVGVRVGVLVGVGVTRTVNVPLVRLVVTPPPAGFVAAALLKVNPEPPPGALGRTSKITFATEPSAMGVTLTPKTITRTVPEAGADHDRLFPASEAACPIVTLLTESRVVSKLTSKFSPVTWAPSREVRLTDTLMPDCPGIPFPSAIDIAAVVVCADALGA